LYQNVVTKPGILRKVYKTITYAIQNSPSSELTGSQPFKEPPAFYGTRRFITAFTSVQPPVPVLSEINPIHAPTSNFLNSHLNTIQPSTPGSPKWSLSPNVSLSNTCIHFYSLPYVLHVSPISFFSIRWPEKYLVRITYYIFTYYIIHITYFILHISYYIFTYYIYTYYIFTYYMLHITYFILHIYILHIIYYIFTYLHIKYYILPITYYILNIKLLTM